MKQAILAEIISTKYYSIIVDVTPDSSHVEQTAFILLKFSICKLQRQCHLRSSRALSRIVAVTTKLEKLPLLHAELINETLRKNGIPLADCRGQGYDNGSKNERRIQRCPSPYFAE